MPELHYIKLPGGLLRPAQENDVEAMAAIPNGALIKAKIVQPRNGPFHDLFFAMLNFTYGYWEPDVSEQHQIVPEKNFKKFRSDVTILAGYRTAMVNIKNEVRYEADSISFAKMDDVTFRQLYKAAFGVCWKMVLKQVPGMTEIEANNAINQLSNFGH